MKKIYSLLFIITTTAVFAQNPHWEWLTGIESAFANPQQDMVTDALGNMYTCAIFTKDIITDDYEIHNTNPQTNDSFFAKLNSQGQVLWTKKLGGAGSDNIGGFDADAAGNVYITLTYTNGITVGDQTFTGLGTLFAKYDTNGNLVWVRSGTFTFMNSLRVDSAGNIYAAGTFQGGAFTYDQTTLTYSGSVPSFIVKLNNNGNLVWSGIIGGPQNNSKYNDVKDIEIDSLGNVYVGGTYNGGNITFGSLTLNSVDSGNFFLVKYNSEGVAQWAKTSGNSACANAIWDMTLDNAGNIYLAGNFCSTVNFNDTTLTSGTGSRFFIAKYDTSGTLAWIKSSIPGPFNIVHSADFDADGNLVIGGTFNGGVSFGNNVSLTSASSAQYVAFYNADGFAQWAVATGEIDINNTVCVKAMGNHTIYTAGHIIIPSLTFGDMTYTKTGQNTYNIWLGKLVYEDVAETQQFSKTAVAVYPNPVNDVLTVQSENSVQNISVTDCNGRTVAVASNSKTINTSQLSKGIYFASVTTATGKSVHKIVKN